MIKLHPEYVRSIMFGLEDSLISTTGSAIGVSVGIQDKKIIILACLVYVAVEALSMAASQFLSARTVHEMGPEKQTDNLYIGSGLMLGAYTVGGILPILPLVFMPLPMAIYATILFAFVWLYLLGFVKGKLVNISPTKSALEMLIVGGLAALVGVIVGFVLKTRP